jgi:hypothetical protein
MMLSWFGPLILLEMTPEIPAENEQRLACANCPTLFAADYCG